MKFSKLYLLFFMVAGLVACSSSDDGNVALATFVASSRAPGPSQVFLASEMEEGQTITVSVKVRDLARVAASDLVLEYSAARLVFFARLPGSFLEQGPVPVSYEVFEEIPGRLRARIARSTGGTASTGPGEETLVFFRFQVVATGDTAIAFTSDSVMLDEQPAALGGVTFFGGTFVGT